jgi:hypothetical protein
MPSPLVHEGVRYKIPSRYTFYLCRLSRRQHDTGHEHGHSMAYTDVEMPIRVKVYCVIACEPTKVRSVSEAIQSSYKFPPSILTSGAHFGLSMRAFVSILASET